MSLIIENINSDEVILTSLMSNGKSKSVEDFNILEEYIKKYKEKPSTFRIINDDFDFFLVDKVRELMKKEFKNLDLIYQDTYYSLKYKKHISRREVWLIDDGYFLVMNIEDASSFYSNPMIDIKVDEHSELCEFNNMVIPNPSSKYYNKKILDRVVDIFKESVIIENKRPSIGMISVDNGDLYVKEFTLNNKVSMKYMDLHYGEGFGEFSKKLIKKLSKDKKGLVLLHGLPGTGKTYYIRYLLNKLSESDKNILYFPPSMVDTITEPSFVSFINTWVNEGERSCILLIEDAEPLLASRKNDRNIGITNLLNLTDGLLNDIFGIQIIATFNTSISDIDDALLRPERLIARKEFRKLDKQRGLELAKKIKIDESKITKEMSLAEIYAIKKKNEILTHDIKDSGKKLGF